MDIIYSFSLIEAFLAWHPGRVDSFLPLVLQKVFHLNAVFPKISQSILQVVTL